MLVGTCPTVSCSAAGEVYKYEIDLVRDLVRFMGHIKI